VDWQPCVETDYLVEAFGGIVRPFGTVPHLRVWLGQLVIAA